MILDRFIDGQWPLVCQVQTCGALDRRLGEVVFDSISLENK